MSLFSAVIVTKNSGVWSAPLTYMESATAPTWSKISDDVSCLYADISYLNPSQLQIAANETAVYLRDSSTSSNFSTILTLSEIQALLSNVNVGTILDVTINPVTERLYVLFNYELTKGGIYVLYSDNKGSSWSYYQLYTGSQNRGAATIVADYQTGERVYACAITGLLQQIGVWVSSNYGTTFGDKNLVDTASNAGFIPQLTIDKQDKDKLICAYHEGAGTIMKLVKSDNGGVTWSDIDNGLQAGAEAINYPSSAFRQGDNIYTTRQENIFYTDDGGTTLSTNVLNYEYWAMDVIQTNKILLGRASGISDISPVVITAITDYTTEVDKTGNLPHTISGVARGGLRFYNFPVIPEGLRFQSQVYLSKGV